MLHLPETTVFILLSSVSISLSPALSSVTREVELHSCRPPNSPSLCLPLSVPLVGLFLLRRCRQQCVWTRVSLGARQGESKRVGGTNPVQGIPL